MTALSLPYRGMPPLDALVVSPGPTAVPEEPSPPLTGALEVRFKGLRVFNGTPPWLALGTTFGVAVPDTPPADDDDNADDGV